MLSRFLMFYGMIIISKSVVIFEDDFETYNGTVITNSTDSYCPSIPCILLQGNSNDGYSSITSIKISTINYQNITLKYDVALNYLTKKEYEFCHFQYTINDGSTWNDIAVYDYYVFFNETKELNDEKVSNIDNLQLRVYFDGPTENDQCFVSNMVLYGEYVPTPSITPTTNEPTTSKPTSNPTLNPSTNPTPNPILNPTPNPTLNPTPNLRTYTTTTGSETLVIETTDGTARDSDMGHVDTLHDETMIYIICSVTVVVLNLCIVIICYYYCKKNKKNDSNPPPLHNVVSTESKISINDFGSVITPNSNGDDQDNGMIKLDSNNTINDKVNDNESGDEGDEELYRKHSTIGEVDGDIDDEDDDEDDEELYKEPVHVTIQ